jgi:type II secretory pathway component GspD/PulD (secretin)
MKRPLPAWLSLGLFLVAGVSYPQGTIEVISLRHRAADQVIPVLQPLLEPGGALSGQGYQLIVRTGPANLAQLREVLAAIDRPARRLMISVRFDSAEDAARSRAQAGARLSEHGARVDARIQDSRAAQHERVDQRVQVLEGGEARIFTGELRFWSEASTGFIAVPRVAGSEVTLDLFAQQERHVRGGAIQGQRAASTLSGRLGEWLELGGASTASASSATGPLDARQGARGSDRRMWLMVEELR